MRLPASLACRVVPSPIAPNSALVQIDELSERHYDRDPHLENRDHALMDNPYASKPVDDENDEEYYDSITEVDDQPHYIDARYLRIRQEYIFYERLLLGIGIVFLMTIPILLIVGGISSLLVAMGAKPQSHGYYTVYTPNAIAYLTNTGVIVNLLCGFGLIYTNQTARILSILASFYWCVWGYFYMYIFLIFILPAALLTILCLLQPGCRYVCSSEYKYLSRPPGFDI